MQWGAVYWGGAMSETVKTFLGIATVFVALPLLVLLLRNWTVRAMKKDIAEASRKFNERLFHPDFAALEAHFKHSIPAGLRALYYNRQELERGDFLVAPSPDAPEDQRWFVAFYEPADEESLRDAWPGIGELFAFANDGCGNEYVVDPRLEDPPVRFYDHETGEFLPVCERVSEFMNWLRLEAKLQG